MARRNYRLEYQKYQSSSEAKLDRASRNRARRNLMARGVVAKGDGTEAEKKSQSVKIDVKYLNSINASDLITEYMILKLKDYLNMQ